MHRRQIEEVKYVTKDSGGFRVHGIDDKSVEVQVPLIDVRAAVTPPQADRPGYYLVLGVRFSKNESGKHPLMFLAEHEDVLQSSLLKRLSDDAARLSVQTVYADESNAGYYSDLWRCFKTVLEVRVCRALHPQDVDYGVTLIREWLGDNALELPRYTSTILRRQLGLMTVETVGMMNVIDPLRFLVSAFVNNPPVYVRSGGQDEAVSNWYY